MIKTDPVLKAQDFLTAYIFLRRDVASAPGLVRIQIEKDDIFARKIYQEALDSAQSRLTLITGMTLEADSRLPLQKSGEQVDLAGDTATLAGGPALYFELAEK